MNSPKFEAAGKGSCHQRAQYDNSQVQHVRTAGLPAYDGLQGLHGALVGSRCAAAADNSSLQVSQALAVALRPLCQLLSCCLHHKQDQSHSSHAWMLAFLMRAVSVDCHDSTPADMLTGSQMHAYS